MRNNITYGKVSDLFPRTNTILVADQFIRDKNFCRHWDCPKIWIEASEDNKTLASAERIIKQLIELEADRDTLLIGMGGGIVTDLTGFVASIYKRGLRYGLVPTTLLAQVDAAIGGKNGVNFDRYKNMIGTFGEAEFIYIDTELLSTLPRREMLCGAAEMLKTFIIGDAKAYEQAVEVFKDPQAHVPESLVRRAGEIKWNIVDQDPLDKGARHVLNLGHTFGHAIEKISTQYKHGEAVAIGIVMAAEMAVREGIAQQETVDLIRSDFKAIGLPVEAPASLQELEPAILQDKKREGATMKYVLPLKIGKVTIWESSVTASRK